jgi:hypothetical protein
VILSLSKYLFAGAGLALGLVIGYTGGHWMGVRDGRALQKAEQVRVDQRAAEIARQIERDNQQCLADPDCVLDDPFRRRSVPNLQPNKRE